MERLVVVPTYNERENIDPLIERLLALPHGLEVLVVDDGSPDGTAAVVRQWMAKSPRVHLMERPGKMGLGSAYRQGFRWALDQGAQLVLQMDADFSHDPDSIGDLIAATNDADVAMGSRYVNGVTVVNWPLRRLILSYSANTYTRIVTRLPVRDATGGFRCYRRAALERIHLDRIKTEGYGFQVEMAYRCWKAGFRLKEVPIVFVDRRVGQSKMSRKIVIEAAGMVWKLRLLDLLGRLE